MSQLMDVTNPNTEVKEPRTVVQVKRQHKVLNYMNRYPMMTDTEMARRLGVSKMTISRDKQFLNQDGMDWGNQMAQGGFLRECRDELAKVENILSKWTADAEKFRKENSKGNIALEEKIIKYTLLKVEAKDAVPMYHKFSVYAKMIEDKLVNV